MKKLTLLTSKDRNQWNILEHNLNLWLKIRLNMLPERDPQFSKEVKATLTETMREVKKLISYVDELGENPTMDRLLKYLNQAVHDNAPRV